MTLTMYEMQCAYHVFHRTFSYAALTYRDEHSIFKSEKLQEGMHVQVQLLLGPHTAHRATLLNAASNSAPILP